MESIKRIASISADPATFIQVRPTLQLISIFSNHFIFLTHVSIQVAKLKLRYFKLYFYTFKT